MSAVSPPAMYERGCAICGVKAHQSWMKAEVDFAALDGFAFASRKLPEYMHFDLALCPECDLVFANAVPDTAWFQSSYRDAQFDAENESKYAAQTYANEIKKLLPILSHRQSALDIGAGDGAFVASLLDAGFANVIGVEPSVEPVKRAAPKVKHFLKYDLLRPGGMFVTVVHDFRAPLARFLGKKSPIYDIEHLQLFSPKSMTSLYQKVGFSDVSVQSLRNAYPLSYWLRLMPLPKIIKYRLLSTITSSSFGNRLISAKVGNLLVVGIKRS